ncbi:hypothetical protein [Saccharopolyspora taberi]|uniref:Uncharacterized protein n=1 Tax=Saccharopolyspora taberi TaxID=60895 RepID=A0ABN3VD78_9PSEU
MSEAEASVPAEPQRFAPAQPVERTAQLEPKHLAEPAEQLQPRHLAEPAKTVERSAAEVRSLHRSVESQDVWLDPAAGKRLREMLDEQLSRVEAWMKRSEDLARQAPLGRNPVGTAMAEKFAGRAGSTDEHSFAGVLQRYREVLEDARGAVDDAMRTYRQVDEQAADSFRKLI